AHADDQLPLDTAFHEAHGLIPRLRPCLELCTEKCTTSKAIGSSCDTLSTACPDRRDTFRGEHQRPSVAVLRCGPGPSTTAPAAATSVDQGDIGGYLVYSFTAQQRIPNCHPRCLP